ECREIAGFAERMLTPGGGAVTRGVPREASGLRLVQHVRGARRQAAARGRIRIRAALPGKAAVGVARGGLGWLVRPDEAGRDHAARRDERPLRLPLLLVVEPG